MAVQIEILVISGCVSVSDKGFKHLANGCRQLKLLKAEVRSNHRRSTALTRGTALNREPITQWMGSKHCRKVCRTASSVYHRRRASPRTCAGCPLWNTREHRHLYRKALGVGQRVRRGSKEKACLVM